MQLAIDFIRCGRLVAFPTETVYGLGADASNDDACSKIFQIKQRPTYNPLIVHVDSLERARELAYFSDDALKIAERFWPGPLTLVLKAKENNGISKMVTGGLDTIAIRVPGHRTALELIRKSSSPIAAPSANPSGYLSPTSFEHVSEHFQDQSEVVILKGSRALHGIESTILDVSYDNFVVLRHGYLTMNAIQEVVKKEVVAGDSAKIKAPGMLQKHYSPQTAIKINASSCNRSEVESMEEVSLNFGQSNIKAVFSLNLSVNADLIEAASNLYDMLRSLDKYSQVYKLKNIVVAKIPHYGLGIAINDKLRRAAC
ncbi:Threonylcarbamoyl-AMP synthase [Rickettsiales endosymbiont of Paramecium tredecaurelia]|uniref:L-threonylcarbamoyladenylate synthase n=1 Tax=Candidatus Sarmatiella mevalonica TaxID=2770581 RepID=UPI001923E2BC|nr:L-threonylcarbamoyladenylate synthase [Candidatus Sarmatiella mevalonica]MBL3285200.1 Threonylcarbamoyl-AMP synthase [Candidatus Sarmatiella mevalonica]